MKKLCIRVVSVMVLLLCVAPLFVSVHAIIPGEDTAPGMNRRIELLFERQLEKMIACSPTLKAKGIQELPFTIDRIVEIRDFAGNVYTLAECLPTGYMIFHNESGAFVEYSVVAESPYGEIDGGKYAGVGQYYFDKEEGSVHTIDGHILSANEETLLAVACVNMRESFLQSKNEDVVNYLNGTGTVSLDQIYAQEMDDVKQRTIQSNGYTYVYGCNFFQNLRDCGFVEIENGVCGYIAAAMLLSYDNIMNAMDTVSPGYITRNNDGSYSISPRLSRALYMRGTDNSSWSPSICAVVEEWMIERSINVYHSSLVLPLAGDYEVKAKIDMDRPVIWFGNISNYTMDDNVANESIPGHAVLVYGYKYKGIFSGYEFVAHLGWNGYNEVYFTGVMGSMYTYFWD